MTYFVYLTNENFIVSKFDSGEEANNLVNSNNQISSNNQYSMIEAPEDNNSVNYTKVVDGVCIVETQDEINEEKLEQIRIERNRLLLNCDWTDLPNCPLSDEKKTEWQSYRTALRDFPSSIFDLDNITWPIAPS